MANQTKASMLRDIEKTGKATYVHGSNRRHAVAVRLIESGDYWEIKVGYNLYNLVSVADEKIRRMESAGLFEN